MRKILYLTPAIVVCVFYLLMAILVGGISGFQPIVLLYMGAPILAAWLLLKKKWWGCIPGLVLGGYLLWMGSQYTGQVMNIERPLGIVFLGYYLAMGMLCFGSSKRTSRRGGA